tara:strand:- start:194 stop:649 length:456 start_codon:yes stop_codon:yes gene_type:complete
MKPRSSCQSQNLFPKLTTGMLVLFQNGKMGIVLNDIISVQNDEGKYGGDWAQGDFNEFAHDGQSVKYSAQWNIIKVSKPLSGYKLAQFDRWTKSELENDILWESTPTFVNIELNSEHTAQVGPEEVTVGCQTFPIHKIELILEAANRLKGK